MSTTSPVRPSASPNHPANCQIPRRELLEAQLRVARRCYSAAVVDFSSQRQIPETCAPVLDSSSNFTARSSSV